METFAAVFDVIYQLFDNIGFLILAASGLVIIFGMMGVINMAHGELMMIGAYITAFSYHAGIPAPIAIIFAGIGAGLVGMILERLVIRHFYKQLLSSLVVTWGLSLLLSQGFLIIFGPSILNVPTPFGNFPIGEQTFGIYRLVLFAVAIAMVASVWAIFTYTKFGTRARATMEDPDMANALGVNTGNIYALTFGLGCAMGGIAGGMFALTATISPFFGINYTPLAFITVVTGGSANAISGLISSALSLAGIQTGINNLVNVYIGYVAMIGAAFVILLILPKGISEYIERRKIRVRKVTNK
ncbi:MAG: branched-chain amino acid ABC transporter permease [Rhodospirillaceae bacterium]|nr:branched-chain amino acid ABC transporter permease [Rhodospirillaceae bacterium]|tara:strand:- start:6278 stop:7177 length:900 start_codon:yes stop_codon:yes gene_type:complete